MGTTVESPTPGAPAPASHPPLSVAIRTIGVIGIAMAGSTISSQLVDLGIADLGGGFSISSDEASWIACVGTMAEAVAIPIAATLVRVASLRRIVLMITPLYGLCALLSLLAASEDQLLVLRTIQSFCGGIMSVLMMVAVMTSLPAGAARYVGLATFGLVSSAPSALAAAVGGFVTDNFGWQGLYLFDIAWALGFLLLAWPILRRTPSAMNLSEVDWVTYVVLSVGLAALILFMKQGDRFFWLESSRIRLAGLLAAVALPIAVLLLAVRKRPLMDLALLAKPTFGWAILLATVYRFGLVMIAFVVPQALTRLQGYRMPEIAQATIWMFWAQCIAFPVAWLWASRGDARLPLSAGLMLFAIGASVGTFLTPDWQAGDFRLILFVIGLGQGLFLVPTVFYATRDVAPQQGTTAASLFNLSRVVGQTFGTAVIGSLITEREKFHSAVLVDNIANASPALAARQNGLVEAFLAWDGDRGLAQLQAMKSISDITSKQAYVLAFADAFTIIAPVLAASALLVLMLPPLRSPTKEVQIQPISGPAVVESAT